jgi:hypothetical protein
VDFIINLLIKPLLQPLLELINQNILLTSYKNIFFFEKSAGINSSVLTSLQAIISSFAISILTLKLLKKLFDIYIFGTDGDDTTSPFEYLKSFIKGVVIIIAFTVFYDWLGTVMIDFTDKLLAVVPKGAKFDAINKDLFTIFFLVYFIIILLLYVQMLMNGVRLFVLRMAIPLSCVGLIDANNGIYDVVMKKFFQTAVTGTAQMVLIQISVLPVSAIRTYDMSSYTLVISAIALAAYSLKLSQDLNEIFLMSAGSGAGSKATRGMQAIWGAFKAFAK